MIRGDTAPNWHNRVPVPVIASRLGSVPSSAVALVGAGDPASSRVVYSMVIGLVVIGLLLALVLQAAFAGGLGVSLPAGPLLEGVSFLGG